MNLTLNGGDRSRRARAQRAHFKSCSWRAKSSNHYKGRQLIRYQPLNFGELWLLSRRYRVGEEAKVLLEGACAAALMGMLACLQLAIATLVMRISVLSPEHGMRAGMVLRLLRALQRESDAS